MACSSLFLSEPAGSCLTSAELILPYWALLGQACWSCLTGRPPSTQPLMYRALSCVRPVPWPWRSLARTQRPVSLWLLGSGSKGHVSGARLLALRLSREGDRVSGSLQSLRVQPPLQPSLPPTPGASRAFLGSQPKPRPTQHTHDGFLPTFPFRV